MKVAALQMDAVFADVQTNLECTENYIVQAAQEGVELLVLPEFFPSAIGFSPKMLDAAMQGERVRHFLHKWAGETGMIIGGSFLLFDGKDCRNTFDLAFPDGSRYTHCKDIPTQFENCYYTYGDTKPVLHTPLGDIGVALCWEMLRTDTLKRLSGQVDVVVAGSCWWDLPVDAPTEREPLRRHNQQLAMDTPVTFARLLHAPVIHASHCGRVTAGNFPAGDGLRTRLLVGAAQIIDENGTILSRREFSEGAGLVSAEFPVWPKRQTAEIADQYWIPDLPEPYRRAWETINPAAQEYYENTMRERYLKKGS